MTSSDLPAKELSSRQPGREFAVSGMALWEWWQAARQAAIAHAIPPAEVDWLLQEWSGLDRLALRLESFKAKPQVFLKASLPDLQQLWQKRVQERVPVQYLVGYAPWREFSLQVSPAVLIPRPETECLIDLAIAATPPTPDTRHPTPASQGHWADLGTGSGAIALGLATAFPQATIHAVDYSPAALAIAQSNAAAYGLQERIHFYQGSWFQPLKGLVGKLSGVVSNPPYIPSKMVLELQPEVTDHEPHLALDGGADGLDCLRHLIHTAPDYLQSGGILLLEMMAGQAPMATKLLHQQGSYTQIEIHADLAGIDRFALAFRQ